jgi:S1-C subfamily serine protease
LANKAEPDNNQPSPPPTKAPEPSPTPFASWLQNVDESKTVAKREGKDLLLLFDSSDWSSASKSLATEVFAKTELQKRLSDRFVLVHLDFPEYPTAKSRVRDARRNEYWQSRFFKNPAYPRTILTDADVRPYAMVIGYESGQTDKYVSSLERATQTRSERDLLLHAVEAADGKAKLPAARKAWEFLGSQVEGPSHRGDGTFVFDLREFYQPLLQEWEKLAETHDRDNQDGAREFFFWHDWCRRVDQVVRTKPPDRASMLALADELNSLVESGCQLKNTSYGISLLAKQADLFARLNMAERRDKAIDAALALKPSPNWQAHLQALRKSGRPDLRTQMGTGFAVTADGYILTNRHVIRNAKAVKVRWGDSGRQPISAKVTAQDESNDLALLKIDVPVVYKLPPVRIASRAAAGAGTETATLGYALGATDTKFTRGSISQRTEEANSPPLLLLDVRINPGNSGGPLFDACGNVVGIVTAKLSGDGPIDSYGIAVAANALDRFLRMNLKEFRPPAALTKKLEWPAAIEVIKPSVVQVIAESPGG